MLSNLAKLEKKLSLSQFVTKSETSPFVLTNLTHKNGVFWTIVVSYSYFCVPLITVVMII